MLDPEVVAAVEHLLAGGDLSHREVARMTGVSRGTVASICLGRRRCHARVGLCEDDPPDCGPAGRCTGCGGWVYKPCRLCAVRSRPHPPDAAR